MTPASRRYAVALWTLFGLFVVRVAAQRLIALGGGSFLPPWEAWFSGALGYPPLLASQIVIILLYGRIAVDVTRGRGVFAVPRRRAAAALIAGGSVYLAVMALRYAIRMTLYRPERWSGGSIPIFFHWVLAGFIVLGFYHRRFAPAASSSLHPVRARVLQSVAGLSIVIGVAAFVSYQIAPTLLARVLGARPAEYAVRIERLVFRQGHRIRLEVASSNFPRYDRNLNTGAPIATATVTAVARQAVHHRPGALSRIVLPVVPSGSSRLNRDEPRESGSLHIAHSELVEP